MGIPIILVNHAQLMLRHSNAKIICQVCNFRELIRDELAYTVQFIGSVVTKKYIDIDQECGSFRNPTLGANLLKQQRL